MAAALAVTLYEPPRLGRHVHEKAPSAFGVSLTDATLTQRDPLLRSTRSVTAGRAAPSCCAVGAATPVQLDARAHAGGGRTGAELQALCDPDRHLGDGRLLHGHHRRE